MNTSDFFQPANSKKLSETISKQFGIDVDLKNYDREQLENVRNKLRTIQFHHEQNAGINDLLTNEAYQKNQAMLQLINTRIKEMLGEDIKKLKLKLQMIEEGKKGVKIAKHPRPSKSSGDGNLANNYPPYDKVTRGDVVAGATGKDQKGGKAKKEESVEEDSSNPFSKNYKSQITPTTPTGKYRAATGHDVDRSKPGVIRASRGSDTFDNAPDDKREAEKRQQRKDARAARKATVESAGKSCNHTVKGKMCEVHGKKACPMDEGMSMAKGPNGTKDLKRAKMAEAQSIFRRNVRIVNENLARMIYENEEEKAKAITAASDIVNDYTSWMQRVGQYQTKALIELADAIRSDFGAAEAETFKQTVSPALAATLETLMAQREVISNAVAVLAGEQSSAPPMGTEPEAGSVEPEMGPTEPVEPAAPDAMNEPAADEFAGSEPASTSREIRESRFVRKLAESHSIISKLAR